MLLANDHHERMHRQFIQQSLPLLSVSPFSFETRFESQQKNRCLTSIGLIALVNGRLSTRHHKRGLENDH